MLKTKQFLDNVKCAKCASGCKATHFMSVCQHFFCECCANALKGATYRYQCSVCSTLSTLVIFADVKREIDDHIKKNEEFACTKKITEENLNKSIGLLKNEKETLKKHSEELQTIEKQLGATNKSLIDEIATLKQKHESIEEELNEHIGLMKTVNEISKKHAEENFLLKQKQVSLEESRKYQHGCIECEMRHLEQNMHLCATCHELKFVDLVDVKKNALCSTCAIKKHMRQGHQIVDFFPYLSAHNFSSQTPTIELKSEELKDAQKSMKDMFSDFDALSKNASELHDCLTDMARRSKSTKHQAEFFEKMGMFIDKSKSIHVKAGCDLKESSKILQEYMINIKDWYESRKENCVDDSETIKLPSSSD